MTALSYAYPRIVGGLQSSTTPNATTHTVTLQNATNSPIIVGHLILIFAAFDGAPTVTWPSGWTQLLNATNGATNTLQIYYRIADGGEPDTIDLTTSASEEMVARVMHVERHSSSTNPPEVASTTGTSSTPNPPSLTASGGSNDYIWFSIYAADGSATTDPFTDTNYPFGFNVRSSAGVDQTVLAYSRRRSTAASENPGAMALSASDQWIAATVVVYPGDEGLVTVPQISDVVTTATSGTSHTFSLPSYSIGDLLVAAVGSDGSPTFTWPAGWTTLCADTSAAAAAKTGVRYRIADGTEGASIAFSTSASEECAAVIMAIIGHDAARPPVATISGGSGDTASSAALTTGTGVADYLWLGGAVGDLAAFVAQYENILQEQVAGLQSSGGAGACTLLTAYKDHYADEARIFALRFSTSTQWAAWSAVVYPGEIVVPPGGQVGRRTRAHPFLFRPNVHYIPRRVRH